MRFYDSKVSNTSGEISPLLAARVDLAAYNNGAKSMLNCFALPQGGFMKRPGVKAIRIPAPTRRYLRMIPFVASVEKAWIILFQVMSDGLVFMNIMAPENIGSPTVGFGTTYTEQEVKELTYLQSVDVLYIFHQNHPVRKLVRGDAQFTSHSFNRVTLKNGPYEDYNTDELKRVYFNRATSTMTSNFDLFTPSMVTEGKTIKVEFTTDGKSWDFRKYSGGYGYEFYGPTTIETYGKWWGKVEIIVRPRDTQKLTVIKSWTSAYSSSDNPNGQNFGLSFSDAEYGDTYFISVTEDPEKPGERANLRFDHAASIATRQFKITAVAGPRSATVTPADTVGAYVLDDNLKRVTSGSPDELIPAGSGLDSGTATWALSTFGGDEGYPGIGIFHQERLILANTRKNPTTLWMSQPGDWENFDTSVPALDTDAITVTLASKQANEIVTMSSKDDLMIFTTGAIFTGRGGDRGGLFTPSSANILPAEYRGAAYGIDALEVGRSTLFVTKHSDEVRTVGYQMEADGYVTNDISILSDHLLRNKTIKSWTFQEDPWSIVWIVLDNGDLLSLTFNQEHQVTAWSRHFFSTGSVQDVCVIPGKQRDDLYLIIDGSIYMLKHGTSEDYLDEIKAYVGDVEYHPYTMLYETLELEQSQLKGTIQGRFKHIPSITVRVNRTRAFKAGIVNENNVNPEREPILDPAPIPLRDPEDLYTGDIIMEVPGGISRQSVLRIEDASNSPITILGIWSTVEVPEE